MPSFVRGLASIAADAPISLDGPRGQNGSEAFTLRIGDEVIVGTAQRLGPSTYVVRFGAHSVTVDLAHQRGQWVARAGRSDVKFVLEDALARRLHAVSGTAKATGETVVAPIAGKVIALPYPVGAPVQAGQCVAVLEAMKMENELLAEHGGVIDAHLVSVGAAVAVGEAIVRLKAVP